MPWATFRFYAELNDFLPPERRQRDIAYEFLGSPTVKDAIESLGVPHVEVDLIVVNGESVGFDYHLREGDRVAVYPIFESLDISPLTRLRPRPLRRTAFVCDVHLGKLCRILRLLGFDAIQPEDPADRSLIEASRRQGRILLTRDRELLKHGSLTHGYWVRSDDPLEQAREVIRRFDLSGQARPFTRCPTCNGLLRRTEKAAVADRIPPRTAAWIDEYYICSGCGKLYWRGTHYRRLRELISRLLTPS